MLTNTRASLLLIARHAGEAYFMCSATILTPSILVSAAHCFNEKYEDTDWFARVGDNFIGKPDPSEQTFQVFIMYQSIKIQLHELTMSYFLQEVLATPTPSLTYPNLTFTFFF